MSSTISRQYLVDYLQEEFRRYPEVRVSRTPSSASADSTEESEEAHERDGVRVRTETREYFFAFDWVENRRFDRIAQLVQQIKEVLPER